jgi:hypothetical protein
VNSHNVAKHTEFHARGTVVPNTATASAPAVEIKMATFTGAERASCVFWFDEGDQEGRIHFQQDGAPPHYLGEVREYLNTRFPGRWIGRAAPIAWPPRSPDLTPLDFFLWGFVKDRVFVPPLPANVVELRTRITAAVADVTPEMLRSVRQETDYGWDVCRITSGSHIEP